MSHKIHNAHELHALKVGDAFHVVSDVLAEENGMPLNTTFYVVSVKPFRWSKDAPPTGYMAPKQPEVTESEKIPETVVKPSRRYKVD